MLLSILRAIRPNEWNMKREIPTEIYSMAPLSTMFCPCVEPIFTDLRFICFGFSVPVYRTATNAE
jgi:hypothetical protein